MTVEIPWSPISRHDLDAIRGRVNAARMKGLKLTEVHVSDRRLKEDGLRLFGYLPVRRRATLELNEGEIIIEGREPTPFSFEVVDE